MNWLNLGIIYWVILLTINLMLVGAGFGSQLQNTGTACVPGSLSNLGSQLTNGTCITNNLAPQSTVSSSVTDRPSFVSSFFSFIGSTLGSLTTQLIPSLSIIGSFVGSIVFGYVGFMSYVSINAPQFTVLVVAIGSIIFIVQVLTGFYLLATAISAVTGNKA